MGALPVFVQVLMASPAARSAHVTARDFRGVSSQESCARATQGWSMAGPTLRGVMGLWGYGVLF